MCIWPIKVYFQSLQSHYMHVSELLSHHSDLQTQAFQYYHTTLWIALWQTMYVIRVLYILCSVILTMKSAVGVSPLNKQHLITSASIISKPSMVLLYHCHWHQFGPRSFTPHKISLRLRVLLSNLSSNSRLWCESESVADDEGLYAGNCEFTEDVKMSELMQQSQVDKILF